MIYILKKITDLLMSKYSILFFKYSFCFYLVYSILFQYLIPNVSLSPKMKILMLVVVHMYQKLNQQLLLKLKLHQLFYLNNNQHMLHIVNNNHNHHQMYILNNNHNNIIILFNQHMLNR